MDFVARAGEVEEAVLRAGRPTQAAADLENSDNVTVSQGAASGSTFKRKFLVKLKASGGLLSTAAGLEVEFGSGVNQAARGNHTHAQLHDALTKLDSESIVFSL